MYYRTSALRDGRWRLCDGFAGHGCYADEGFCSETGREEWGGGFWVNAARLHVGEAAGRGQRSADEKAQS